MDADDVSVPERFEKQLPLIEAGADIVGSGLWEFGKRRRRRRRASYAAHGPGRDQARRPLPRPVQPPDRGLPTHAVLAAGGYTDMALMEDYLLFTRMVAGGAVPANLAEPLVHYRVGDGAYARRGGTQLLRSELALQRRFREAGHHHAAAVPAQRGGPRGLPARS